MLRSLILFTSCLHLVAGSSEPAWLTGLNKFDHISHPFKEEFINLLNDVTKDESLSISIRCKSSLQDFSTGLQRDNFHHMAMLDSFSKIRAGMLTSQGYEYGSYQQCLSHGRYVYFGIKFPLPDHHYQASSNDNQEESNITWQDHYSRGMNVRRLTPYTSATCMPDECMTPDLEVILKSPVLQQKLHPLEIQILTTESKSDPVSKSYLQIIAMAVIVTQILICIVSSMYNAIDPCTRSRSRFKHLMWPRIASPCYLT